MCLFMKLMRCLGLEPRTLWLKVICSSDWANTAGCFPCWRGNDWCFVICIVKLTVGNRVCPYLLPKVRNVGLEPTRRRRQNLNLVRLPVTPIPHTQRWYLCTDGHHSTRSIMISLMTLNEWALGHFATLCPAPKGGGSLPNHGFRILDSDGSQYDLFFHRRTQSSFWVPLTRVRIRTLRNLPKPHLVFADETASSFSLTILLS